MSLSRGPTGDPLTDRKLEVPTLLAAGRSHREIADEIFVTVDTVKKHNTHVLAKLEVANRTVGGGARREAGLIA
jgi:LuxR family maltose regulon positive regulatory protein